MTTKPKAKRFRLQRQKPETPPAEAAKAAAPQDSPIDKMSAEAASRIFDNQHDDGFGDTTYPSLGNTPVGTTQKQDPILDEIAREGLTGRQLRMARRVAQKQGLNPETDLEAVKLLREQGIDPFKRANMLNLVVNDGTAKDTSQDEENQPNTLPSTKVTPQNMPSTELISEDTRASEITAIQRDIVRRRRKRTALLLVRLFFFVVIPTIVAGYYYYNVATPMFATKSEFVIQKAEGGGGSGFGGLFSGTGFATSQDSITVQGYLQSRDALLRLDSDEGFRAHFAQEFVDPLQRIELEGSNESAYKLYKKHVKIGFDPTEGVIKMEVIAVDPETSASFSKALIGYAEEQVDQLTSRLRFDQMEGAQLSRVEANEKMLASQQRIVELQEKLGVFSPETEAQAIFSQIGTLESELLTERLSLRTTLDNRRPNEAKVNASRNKIRELELLIAEKRDQLTQSTEKTDSLARVTAELLVAQADLETRQALLAQAESAFESARLEANRQVRYLSIGVNPIAPDEPTYPRKFENTILAFLIFGGIYLMVSLTATILREQV
ncbi:MAG: capsule biosynthesis protein [Litoreibacter sp.]